MEVGLQIGAVHKLLPAHKTLRNKRTKSNGHKNCTAGQIQIQLRGRSGFLVERFYGLISPSLEKMPACLVAKQKVQTNENKRWAMKIKGNDHLATWPTLRGDSKKIKRFEKVA